MFYSFQFFQIHISIPCISTLYHLTDTKVFLLRIVQLQVGLVGDEKQVLYS